MRASVIICTRNRAASLTRVLGSIAAATLPRDPWELIVVDNGSQDATPAVIASFADRLPIRRAEELEPGLSNARNRGVAEMRGDYAVWTDDDVLVEEGWLTSHLQAFATYPTVAIFAGQIIPMLEAPVTPWFAEGLDHVESLLALRRFEEVTPLSEHFVPFGANYAVRAAEQKANRYDPNLGVTPTRRRGGEETAVARAILAKAAGLTTPGSVVRHLISPERQTTAYVKSYYTALGEDWPLATPHKRAGLLWGVPPKIGARLLASAVSYRLKRWTGGDWLGDYVMNARLLGTRRAWLAQASLI